MKNEERLRDLTKKGLQQRLGNIPANKHKHYFARLDAELDAVIEKSYTEDFLRLWDFSEFALKENIYLGVCYGASPSLLTLYAFNITNLDPVAHGLFFERALNKSHNMLLDIHIGICPSKLVKVRHFAEKGFDKLIVTFSASDEASFLNSASRIHKANSANAVLSAIPINDEKVFKALCFDISGNLFKMPDKKLLQAFCPKSLAEFAAVIAIDNCITCNLTSNFFPYRSRIMKYTEMFPVLAPIFADSYGMLLHQEQVMQIACKLANFTGEEADNMRRAIGNNDALEIEAYRKHFIIGASDYNSDITGALYDLLCEMHEICQLKAHTISCALAAYHITYLCCEHPKESKDILRHMWLEKTPIHY